MNRSEIPIATPCHADWSTMTLADGGRFCGACRKVVRELRQMTEAEARALLAAPPTEGLCVRYVHDATGEVLFRRDDVIPAGKLLRRAAAVALAVLPLSTVACMGAAPALTGSPPAVPVAASSSAQPPPPPPPVVMGAPPAPADSSNR